MNESSIHPDEHKNYPCLRKYQILFLTAVFKQELTNYYTPFSRQFHQHR